MTSSQVIGNYLVGKEIGRGSFATVYKAVDRTSSVEVAVKSVLREKLTRKLLESLETEIAILKGIRHPHIVELVDCQKSTTHIHLIMEFCSLGDLSNFIKKKGDISGVTRLSNAPPVGNVNGGLSEHVARHFLTHLSAALEFLRLHNLIHRDLKPQNLLLLPAPNVSNRDPQVPSSYLPFLKIADFGFARSLSSSAMAETLCGSPLYMAPEILRYEKYDAKADLWSLGAVLYEMLVGKPPFRAQNHIELLRKIERGADKIRFPGEERNERGVVALGTSPSQGPASVPRSGFGGSSGVALSHKPTSNISVDMKDLVRKLLKRNPVERVSFEEFFMHACITGRVTARPSPLVQDIVDSASSSSFPFTPHATSMSRRPSSSSSSPLRNPYTASDASAPPSRSTLAPLIPERQGTVPGKGRTRVERHLTVSPLIEWRNEAVSPKVADAWKTADPVEDIHGRHTFHVPAPSSLPNTYRIESSAATATSQRRHRMHARTPSASSSERRRIEFEEKELQLQLQRRQSMENSGIVLEREYVVVEKRKVEVHAIADGLSTLPKIPTSQQRSSLRTSSPSRTYRSGSPVLDSSPTTALSSAVIKPMSIGHRIVRSPSTEWSAQAASTATSVLAKAISTASARLFGGGASSRGDDGEGLVTMDGQSSMGGDDFFPLTFPASASPPPPTLFHRVGGGEGEGNGKEVVLFEGNIHSAEVDILDAVESIAQCAYVVVRFADSKMEAVHSPVPLMGSTLTAPIEPTPSANASPRHTLAVPTSCSPFSSPVAVASSNVSSSAPEEALVLYVKALEVLQAGMNTAKRYWGGGERVPSVRLNNAVQWIRGTFNACLAKAELAKHACPTCSPSSSLSLSSSAEGMANTLEAAPTKASMCAEKLIYDRAAEIARGAAVNELVGEDLFGCERGYKTALLLLRVLVVDDEPPCKQDNALVNEEDRAVVNKFIASITVRLDALHRRMAMVASRGNGGVRGSVARGR